MVFLFQSPKGRKSVGELLERLEELLKELDPWEFKLQQANKKARMKMCKEKEMYKEEAEPQVSLMITTDDPTANILS